MLIYLDNCALNRLFDEPTNSRIVLEAAGVREVLRRIEAGEHKFVFSAALYFEICQIQDYKLRADLLNALPTHSKFVAGSPLLQFAAQLVVVAEGLAWFDALHVASAAAAGADVLFTTDDDILKAARRNARFAWSVKIANPQDWRRQLL